MYLYVPFLFKGNKQTSCLEDVSGEAKVTSNPYVTAELIAR
jgi:hypothetical protein